MKTIPLLAVAIFLSLKLLAQNTPSISENNLLQKEDIKKKAGWIKIRLDSNFREVANDERTKYEYYDFCNSSGKCYLSFFGDLAYPKSIKKSKIIYTQGDSLDKSKLLNGTVDFYDKKNHRAEKYIFKNGFYIKLYNFYWMGMFKKKYNGKLNWVVEFAPKSNTVECWGNFFNEKGDIYADIRELIDGYSYKKLPIRIGSISLNDLNIGTVWRQEEFNSYQYDIFIDTVARGGKKAATIKSIDKRIIGSGALVQTCKADNYFGKRVRMSGYVKSENVVDWSALWLRVNAAGTEEFLSFDNMEDRRIKGTTSWTKYEIVFDVPTNASIIKFGAILHGTGQIWFDDITFEIVDDSVKTTGFSNASVSNIIPSEPANLDFEK